MIRPTKTPNRALSATYVLLSMGIMVVAAPRLPRLSVNTGGVFAICWIAFALAVLGANLWFAVGADHERRTHMTTANRKRRTVAHDRDHQAAGERLVR
ncbi:MAG: hypothetical protein ACYCVB_08560 [Bacilli bacterium]